MSVIKRKSCHAFRNTRNAERENKIKRPIAITKSGQLDLNIQTATAAKITASPSATSLREHSHADDMFTSLFLYGVNNQRQNKLATKFKIAATPIVSKIGISGCNNRKIITYATTKAELRINIPLNIAMRAFTKVADPITIKLKAYVNESPKLSRAPESKDEDPLIFAAITIIRKVIVLIIRTIIKTRRCLWFNAELSKLSWQQFSLIYSDNGFTILITIQYQHFEYLHWCVS